MKNYCCVSPKKDSLFLQINDDFYMESRALGIRCITADELTGIPELSGTKVIRDLLKDVARKSNDNPISLNMNAPFSVLAGVCSDEFYSWLIRNPDEVHNALRKLTSEIAKTVAEILIAGAVMVSFADPLASMETLGKKYYQEFVTAYQEHLVNLILQRSTKGIIHLCPYGFGKLEMSFTETPFDYERYDKILLDLPYRKRLHIIGNQCPNTEYSNHIFVTMLPTVGDGLARPVI